MKTLLTFAFVCISYLSFAQMDGAPPPPKITFPAQFPGGTKVFVAKVLENIDLSKYQNAKAPLKANTSMRIDTDGNTSTVGASGPNEDFNNDVRAAMKKVTTNVKWQPGKNIKGETVIDVVFLPIIYDPKKKK